MKILITLVVLAAIVGAYLFAKNNKNKASAVDKFVVKQANTVEKNVVSGVTSAAEAIKKKL